jgi:cytochrome P450
MYVVNRSPKYFHDPDTFAPERWLPKGERLPEFDNDRLTACKPFSIGFHNCLGKPLAWLEMRLALTRILWAFDITEEDGMQVHFDNFPMMMMVEKQPLWLRVRVRPGVSYKSSSS